MVTSVITAPVAQATVGGGGNITSGGGGGGGSYTTYAVATPVAISSGGTTLGGSASVGEVSSGQTQYANTALRAPSGIAVAAGVVTEPSTSEVPITYPAIVTQASVASTQTAAVGDVAGDWWSTLLSMPWWGWTLTIIGLLALVAGGFYLYDQYTPATRQYEKY